MCFGRGADTVPSAQTPPSAPLLTRLSAAEGGEGLQAAGTPCPHCSSESTNLGKLCVKGLPNTGT